MAPTADYACPACGNRMTVPPGHVGAVWCPCGSPDAMVPEIRFGCVCSSPEDPVPVTASRAVLHMTQFGQRSGPVRVEVSGFSFRFADEQARDIEDAAEFVGGLAGRTVEVSGYLPPETLALFCGEESGQNLPGLIPDHLGRTLPESQAEVDTYPWIDAMSWRPGNAES